MNRYQLHPPITVTSHERYDTSTQLDCLAVCSKLEKESATARYFGPFVKGWILLTNGQWCRSVSIPWRPLALPHLQWLPVSAYVFLFLIEPHGSTSHHKCPKSLEIYVLLSKHLSRSKHGDSHKCSAHKSIPIDQVVKGEVSFSLTHKPQNPLANRF